MFEFSALAPPASSDWLTGLHSPLIQEDGEEKKLKLRFDVSQYTPEEIVVKTVDQKLMVTILLHFVFLEIRGIFVILSHIFPLWFRLQCESWHRVLLVDLPSFWVDDLLIH